MPCPSLKLTASLRKSGKSSLLLDITLPTLGHIIQTSVNIDIRYININRTFVNRFTLIFFLNIIFRKIAYVFIKGLTYPLESFLKVIFFLFLFYSTVINIIIIIFSLLFLFFLLLLDYRVF